MIVAANRAHVAAADIGEKRPDMRGDHGVSFVKCLKPGGGIRLGWLYGNLLFSWYATQVSEPLPVCFCRVSATPGKKLLGTPFFLDTIPTIRYDTD